jgi:sugar phosphate isomerase/epimerase
MQLGFVTAILPDFSLEEVLAEAAEQGFSCVEVMCWPVGKAERRYAGVTHIDVTDFTDEEAEAVTALTDKYGVSISSLGYYPNPLDPDENARTTYSEHIKKVIDASDKLGIGTMTTFIGRDPNKPIEDSWDDYMRVWEPLVQYAADRNVNIGIENCPMIFSLDEWPGGKNLAISPEVWATMFDKIPAENFGLNFDPSHLIWQMIDYERAIFDFADRIVHVHAKDERINTELLYQRGILGLEWHTPKLPGLGSVDWGKFFYALTEIRYAGPVCIEVEDRAYEGSLDDVKRSLSQSKRHLEQFMY